MSGQDSELLTDTLDGLSDGVFLNNLIVLWDPSQSRSGLLDKPKELENPTSAVRVGWLSFPPLVGQFLTPNKL